MGGIAITSVYFVRHAQPEGVWPDDRTRPLTPLGLEERRKATALLSEIAVDAFYSSPYKRSVDTIAECAEMFKMDIHTDERFRERQSGENGYAIDVLERRWRDFDFCEEGGESLASTQMRNIQALNEVLNAHNNSNIVIGTHGTALSTILNYYDASFNCDGFKRIWHSMPYIIRVDFENGSYKGKTELLNIQSFH